MKAALYVLFVQLISGLPGRLGRGEETHPNSGSRPPWRWCRRAEAPVVSQRPRYGAPHLNVESPLSSLGAFASV